MAKQTMGTPCQALTHRCDTKMYRLQNPQTPIARTKLYRKYHMDEYPNGTNAVVAVLAYTGVRVWQEGQGLGFRGRSCTESTTWISIPMTLMRWWRCWRTQVCMCVWGQ